MLYSITEGSQCRNTRQQPGGRKWNRNHIRKPLQISHFISYTTKPHIPSVAIASSELGPSKSNINQETALKVLPAVQSNGWPIPRWASVCVKLTKHNQNIQLLGDHILESGLSLLPCPSIANIISLHGETLWVYIVFNVWNFSDWVATGSVHVSHKCHEFILQGSCCILVALTISSLPLLKWSLVLVIKGYNTGISFTTLKSVILCTLTDCRYLCLFINTAKMLIWYVLRDVHIYICTWH